MKFKLIVAFVDDRVTNKVIQAARDHGATGATIIPAARGEGMESRKGIFGLSVESRRDIILFTVEQHMSRHILEKIPAGAACTVAPTFCFQTTSPSSASIT